MSRNVLIGGLAALIAAAIAGSAAYHFRSSDPATLDSDHPVAAAPKTDLGPAWFRDVSADSGLTHTYRNGEEAGLFTILESLGGGVTLIDYDRDGLLDVFLPGGGSFRDATDRGIVGLPCRLFRNLGDFHFQDVSDHVGVNVINFYSHGGAVADYDRDGWPDLFVTGYGHQMLLHNESDGKNGRVFRDVTASAGIEAGGWSTSAAFADMNGDGFPDLYVCHYVDWSFANHPVCPGLRPGIPRQVCAPQKFKPLVHRFYWNEGGKRFRDATKEQNFQAVGCGLGVVAADLNDDGRPDIYVGNDATNNQLYFNRNGKLEERGLISGVALDEDGNYDGSMGVDVGDFDGSGRAFVFVTNFQGDEHALYQNLGKEIFQIKSRATGIGAIGQHHVGFGTGFVDCDNDGWEDIAIANGHVLQSPPGGSPYRQKPVLLRNVERDGRRFFEDRSTRSGPFFAQPAVGRGLAIGDLNNDGWPDLLFSHSNSPAAVLRNVASASTDASWIGFQLIGKDNRCIVGTTIRVRTTDRNWTRFVKGGGSYLSNPDGRQLVGLAPKPERLDLEIQWSWGVKEVITGLEPGAYWEVHEAPGSKPTRLNRGSRGSP